MSLLQPNEGKAKGDDNKGDNKAKGDDNKGIKAIKHLPLRNRFR